jgi:DNA-binding transcriptional LysR family regulator
MSSRAPDPTAVLTLEALQLVDAIARRGSFAGAAAELGRVPSAITYAVRKLEDDLDVLLFDRRGYRAQLTAAGEELLREGRNLVAAADELTRRVQRVADGWVRELRIALDTVIDFERLLPLIEAFCSTVPTPLRIVQEVFGGTWDALLSDRADLAIGAAYDGPQQACVGPATRRFRSRAWRRCLRWPRGIPWKARTSRCCSPSCASTGRSWWTTPRGGWRRAMSAWSAPATC